MPVSKCWVWGTSASNDVWYLRRYSAPVPPDSPRGWMPNSLHMSFEHSSSAIFRMSNAFCVIFSMSKHTMSSGATPQNNTVLANSVTKFCTLRYFLPLSSKRVKRSSILPVLSLTACQAASLTPSPSCITPPKARPTDLAQQENVSDGQVPQDVRQNVWSCALIYQRRNVRYTPHDILKARHSRQVGSII